MKQAIVTLAVCYLCAAASACQAEAVWHFVCASATRDTPFLGKTAARFMQRQHQFALRRDLRDNPEEKAPLVGHFLPKDGDTVTLAAIARLANVPRAGIPGKTLAQLLEQKGEALSFTTTTPYSNGPKDERKVVMVSTEAIVLNYRKTEHGTLEFSDTLVCTFKVNGRKKHVVLEIGTDVLPL